VGIEDLALSLKENGLIQPIVVNQDLRLIAGGRRLEAAKSLAWKAIDVVFRETLSEDELQVLELEENTKRADITWQERCLATAKIHAIKQRNAALDAETWGERETGALFNMSKGAVPSMKRNTVR
jgi:ParB family chromosome partitioning protein